MPDAVQPPLLPAYRNQQLFSDYYLGVVFREAVWRGVAAEAETARQQIAAIFAAYQPHPKEAEAQTEEELIQPVLNALNHMYAVQPPLTVPGGTQRPDYVFYRSAAARAANKGRILSEALLGESYAVGDAKRWDRPLDQAGKEGGDAFTNKNPTFQIAFYMQHSGAEWGILTNGRLWRLYQRATAHKLDHYYEVDLPALLAAAEREPEQFLYFYAFFRRAAFEPGPLGVDAIRRESTARAQAVSERLRDQVYVALRHLAQGFLDYPNGLQPDPATLREVYAASLIALYRLLFILYGEARELLPVKTNAAYRQTYSLTAIKEAVARAVSAGERLLPGSDFYWTRLKQLFRIINGGEAALDVAPYNGGLFDPQRHPFLEHYSVGDAHLLRAIDQLARVGLQYVDYRDLSVRHLGTIYEGLLEYHLAPLEPPKDGWAVDLLNDKGERKASGSYYTPDYIVKYIVEETLGPVVDAAVAEAADDAARAAAILALNVCDPAMGSGHFLVEATEYLARRLAALDTRLPGATPGEREADYAAWKRRVAQSCIYGVDLNPLAVELAKLSLWLVTVARNHPLSFLDHHLRPGNSLVGARLAGLAVRVHPPGAAPGRRAAAPVAVPLPLRDDPGFQHAIRTAVGAMWLIEDTPGVALAEVKEQEQAYRTVHAQLTGAYGRLADLATATAFGLALPLAPADAQAALAAALAAPADPPPALAAALAAAATLAAERRFFHWELEFPEVFFSRHGDHRGAAAGFDAVIGNPPYDVLAEKERKEDLSQFMSYIGSNDALNVVNEQKVDLYRLFIARAVTLVKSEALVGLIVPMSLLADQQTTSLRKLLVNQHSLITVDAFPQKDDPLRRIFPEAKLPTCVIVAQRMPRERRTFRVTTHPGRLLEEISGSYLCTEADLRALDANSLAIPLLASEAALSLVKRLSLTNDKIQPMGEVVRTYQGEINETTMAGILSTDHRIGPKVLRGGNVGRYIFISEAKQGVDKYINVQEYRKQVGGEKARHTERPRIGYQRNAALDNWRRLIFASLPVPSYCFDSISYFIINDPSKAYASLALLNSRLLEWRFRLTSSNNHVSTREIAGLPAFRFGNATPESRRQVLTIQVVDLYHNDDRNAILRFVEECLATQPEQSDVIQDLVAYLAQQMIDLNQQRHAAVENFILDLEGVLPQTDMQQLGRLWTPLTTPKSGPKDATKKQEDYKKALAEARQQLGPLVEERLELREDIGRINEEQWKWLVRGRLKRIPSLADLVRVYRQRQPAIAALDRRIADTDCLIDQIVYRLYGLTEDEIAIVEQSVK